MEISVRQINIKPHHVKTLITNGIVLVSHLNVFNPEKLSQKVKLPRDECEEIMAAIKPKRPHYVMKASELMIQPFDKISTTIEGLDESLGGGIRCGQVTEISGQSGAGKSNLCAHIGVLVMMSKEEAQCQGLIGGNEGNVLIIHTEGEGKLKLTIKRYNTLAPEKIIKERLHVVNCSSEFELVELVNRLDETLNSIPKVKLVIIDSVTCAFIQTDGNPDYRFYARRSRRLTQLMKVLVQLAWDRRIAVIVTNHVSFNVRLGETRPAMGKHWSHMCQTKIYLERRGGGNDITRSAYVTKGALNTPTIAQFKISDRIQN